MFQIICPRCMIFAVQFRYYYCCNYHPFCSKLGYNRLLWWWTSSSDCSTAAYFVNEEANAEASPWALPDRYHIEAVRASKCGTRTSPDPAMLEWFGSRAWWCNRPLSRTGSYFMPGSYVPDRDEWTPFLFHRLRLCLTGMYVACRLFFMICTLGCLFFVCFLCLNSYFFLRSIFLTDCLSPLLFSFSFAIFPSRLGGRSLWQARSSTLDTYGRRSTMASTGA